MDCKTSPTLHADPVAGRAVARLEDVSGRRVLLQVIGLQRSGNHAIITWITSLFPRPAHFNDMPHDLFASPRAVLDEIGGREGCAVFSFEDSVGRGKLRPRNGRVDLLDSVIPGDPAAFPGHVFRTLYVLRDPYNCWASRVKSKEAGRLSCSPAIEPFIRDWTALARLYLEQPDAFVLYNAWFRDRAYRQRVCARLGGSYSEATLGDVFAFGGGSSFEGHVRPSYRTILRRSGHYLSAGFLRRFLSQPRRYLARLFARNLDGRQLQVESRFQHLIGRPGSRPLFESGEVARLSRAIFGFSVDAQGNVVRPDEREVSSGRDDARPRGAMGGRR